MLLRLFHSMPDLAILTIVVILVTVLAMSAPCVGRRVLRLAANTHRQ